MTKSMTLLLLTSLGISSLKAADANQPGNNWKTAAYVAGGLGVLGVGYYAKKSGDKKAVQRRKGHVVTDATESTSIGYVPGSARWISLGLTTGLMSIGSMILASGAEESAPVFVMSALGLGTASFLALGRATAFRSEYINANPQAVLSQLKKNKAFNQEEAAKRLTARQEARKEAQQKEDDLATYNFSSDFDSEIAKIGALTTARD